MADGLSRFADHLGKAKRPVELLQPLIGRISLSSDTIIIQLNKEELIKFLALAKDAAIFTSDEPVLITAPFQHRKRGVESKLILGTNSAASHDDVLIHNLAKARSWLNDIQSGKTVAAIAKEERRSIRMVQRQLELAFLSPTLVQQIVEGTQPPELTSRQLLHTQIPTHWNKQYQMFGIS